MCSRKIRFWLLLAGGVALLAMADFQTAPAQSSKGYTLPLTKTRSDILPNQLIVRFKDEGYSPSGRTLGSLPDLTSYNLGEHIPVREVRSIDPATGTSAGRQLPGKYLSGLYKVTIDGGDVLEVIEKLRQYDNVMYAEPVFKEQLFLVPNDPDAATSTGKQGYLSSINAYDAWGITTGDSTVVIGIIDTGAQYDHEDLSANVFLNTADPVDGIDNDGNGYIDDYRGWDFANNDNDPVADNNTHGTHVSGIAAARTNNTKGMASASFRSKFIPIKAFKSEDNTSFGTYEAIIYAANQGVDVLNLSWGSTDSYSQAAQDIINYAVLEKDVVIVAAAGNTNEELTFYPASYQNVLSVAASTNDGTKAGFATYGYYVDLVAPGNDAYSTRNGNTYGTSAGSSFSAPQVAGAAALLRSYFPHKSAIEIMELLRTTGSSVDALAGNAEFKGLLGRGMLDMFSALTDTLSPSVRIMKDSLFTQTGQRAYYGDTVHYQLQAINWLKPASGLTITLESLSEHGDVLSGTWTEPALASFDTTSHSLDLLLSENTPPSTRVIVKAAMQASAYSDFQYFEFTTEPDSTTTFSSNVALTVNSDGDLGYTQDSLKAGKGFRFQNVPLLGDAGFLVGNSDSTLADNTVNNLAYSTRNQDFVVTKHLKAFAGTIADNYYENSFTAPVSDNQSVLVEQKNLAWLTPADSNYLITEYRLTNTSADTIASLHAGLFTNWDIAVASENRTVWVDSLKMGLTYIDQNGYYGGIALLTTQTPTFYAADIDNLNGNTADADSLLSDSVKYAWLSSALTKTLAGQSGAGNNTAQMNGVNLGKLPGYKSDKVAFAWVAAESIEGIIGAVQQARSRYAEFKQHPRNLNTFFACLNEPVTLTLPGGNSFRFFADAGTDTLLFEGNGYVTDTITAPTTIFVKNADNPYEGDVFGVKINMDGIGAGFTASEDTVLLEEGEQPIIDLTSNSDRAISWAWDFGNGFQSTLEQPQARYFEPGSYTVTLTTTSPVGCQATSTQTVLVANRAPAPQLDSLLICKDTPAVIQVPNVTTLRVYTDSLNLSPVFEGPVFTSGLLSADTAFYVTNADSLFESQRVRLVVTQHQPVAAFSFLADTTTFDPAIMLINESTGATSFQWYAADTLLSGEQNASLPVTSTEALVRLEASNDLGCVESITTLLTFEKSATPTAEDAYVCPGAPFRLSPGNGSIFLFYDTPNGLPVYKGRSYELTEVSDTTVITITSVDNIIESDPVQVTIFPFDISADFTIEPEVLILKKQKTAEFRSLSGGASSWQWHINNELVDITPNPILAFDSAGFYDIKLIVANNEGCIDSLTTSYEVLEVTGLEAASDFFQLYPNPASQSVTISLVHSFDRQVNISVINMAGQEVQRIGIESPIPGQPISLPLAGLPSGIYTVRLSDGRQTWQHRLIKK